MMPLTYAIGTLFIVHAKPLAMVVPEVELRKVAMQMASRRNADRSRFIPRLNTLEVAFKSVGVGAFVAHPLAPRLWLTGSWAAISRANGRHRAAEDFVGLLSLLSRATFACDDRGSRSTVLAQRQHGSCGPCGLAPPANTLLMFLLSAPPRFCGSTFQTFAPGLLARPVVGLVNLDDVAVATERGQAAARMASRMRWDMNHAVLRVTPSVR